jgi:hypothetical protein
MNFYEDEFPLLDYHHQDDTWVVEIFLLSMAFGNSNHNTDRHYYEDDSCCFIITNKIERVHDPRSLSMINLAFVNPEYTAARYRRGRF